MDVENRASMIVGYIVERFATYRAQISHLILSYFLNGSQQLMSNPSWVGIFHPITTT
jgi:hypothetical protein